MNEQELIESVKDYLKQSDLVDYPPLSANYISEEMISDMVDEFADESIEDTDDYFHAKTELVFEIESILTDLGYDLEED